MVLVDEIKGGEKSDRNNVNNSGNFNIYIIKKRIYPHRVYPVLNKYPIMDRVFYIKLYRALTLSPEFFINNLMNKR